MAAKRVDPMKAKAAKQKKIAIGGGIVLVLLLAVQGPKTLKMLKGPQPAAQAAATTPAPTTPVATTPGTTTPATTTPGTPTPAPASGAPVPGAPEPAGAADLASVPDSDQAPIVDAGQLATFERFSSKDPFAQQAKPVTAPAAAKPKPTGTASDPAADPAAEPSADPGKTSTPAKPTGTATGGGFTTGGSTASPPKLATATSIAVNGVAGDVTLDTPFPAAEPTFVLVSIAENGKSVEIGIAGGEYASGGKTLKLILGQKLTLQNTADGSRYELALLSIQGFPLPAQKG
ncbi:MAG TPA: hypothetical protein VM049_09425 [Gaiellaceae bacterium]|nr:hypothetical protein [Gaiellaceae bacterium]